MKRAFTLIEILLVIAIIGVLAAIIIKSFGFLLKKAYDAEIKREIRQLRLDAESHFQKVENYTSYVCPGVCPDKIRPPSCTNETYYLISSTKEDIAIYSPLCSEVGKYWCVDARGYADISSGPPVNGRCQP